MKVILLTKAVFPFHGYGGIEKYPYYLGKYLIKEGIDVEIITYLDRGKKRVEIYDDIKYVFIPPMLHWRRLSGSYPYRINVARYLRKEKFDILHGYSATPYIYLHFKKRLPTIIQPFGMEVFTAPYVTERRGINKIFVKISSQHSLKYCITHADAVASEGDFQVNQIIELFKIDREKIFNLLIGVDISFIRERLESIDMSRTDLGFSDNDFILISVNRFFPDKGIDYLVDAFNIIKQKIDNAKLILIGGVRSEMENEIYQRTVKQIKSYKLTDSIVLLKNISERLLYDYYYLSDIYVSPTLANDFIMSIQEAMACGLPIVSTGQEFLVKSGINGYTVPKQDPEAIAGAVLKIYYEQLGHKMGKMSKSMVKEYDWEVVTKTAIKKYEELIK